MRTSTRSPFPAILGALALSVTPVVAGSSSAPLMVGVTVVRSCAVRATSLKQGTARLDLTCAAGAASGLRQPNGLDKPSGVGTPLRFQVPTRPFRGAADSGLEVATVNF